MSEGLAKLLAEIKACRLCIDSPLARPLPHEPRPVLLAAATATIGIFGQAPGTRVHACGIPFMDPSGERLREWMAVTADEFYDTSRIAIVPMGFCFPGHDAKGGDLPPRPECAPRWRDRVMAGLPELRLMLLVGQYAHRWHLGKRRCATLTETVGAWRTYIAPGEVPQMFPLPHPSWRNNAWIKRNPWFQDELLPALRAQVRRHL